MREVVGEVRSEGLGSKAAEEVAGRGCRWRTVVQQVKNGSMEF
jgi:hypothetical protein